MKGKKGFFAESIAMILTAAVIIFFIVAFLAIPSFLVKENVIKLLEESQNAASYQEELLHFLEIKHKDFGNVASLISAFYAAEYSHPRLKTAAANEYRRELQRISLDFFSAYGNKGWRLVVEDKNGKEVFTSNFGGAGFLGSIERRLVAHAYIPAAGEGKKEALEVKLFSS